MHHPSINFQFRTQCKTDEGKATHEKITLTSLLDPLFRDDDTVASVLALVQHLDGPIRILEDVEGVTHLLSLRKQNMFQ